MSSLLENLADSRSNDTAAIFNSPAANNNRTVSYSRQKLYLLRTTSTIPRDAFLTLKQYAIVKTRQTRAEKRIKSKIYKMPVLLHPTVQLLE